MRKRWVFVPRLPQQLMKVRGNATLAEAQQAMDEIGDDETPARDVEVPFGQHKGKALGSLPEGYLKVLARMARSKWASLAEEVLNERGSGSVGKKSFSAIMEQDAYVRLLRNAVNVEAVRLVHSRICDSEHQHNVYLLNTLIETYGNFQCLEEAQQVFNGMRFQNLHSWNVMIAVFGQNGRLIEAKTSFDSTPERDITTWTTLLKAYANSESRQLARLVFEKMAMRDLVSATVMMNIHVSSRKSSEAKLVFDSMVEKDVFAYSSLLHAFAQDGRLKRAKATLEKMPEWDVVTVNSMIQAYANDGYVQEAKVMFDEFPERNETTMLMMLRSLGVSGQAEETKALFDQMLRKDEEVWSILLRAYAIGEQIEEAKLIFDQVPQKTEGLWSCLTEGYAQCLQLENAELVFDKAPEWGMRSWIALISAYAICGQEQMARIMFNRMSDWHAQVWKVFIAELVVLGRGLEAAQLFRGMILEGFSPDEATFLSLLNACSIEGLVKEGGKFFAGMVADYGVRPWRDHYCAVVQLLGRAKKLKRAEELVNSMPFEPDFTVWLALFDSCRHHKDVKRGLRAGKQLMLMDSTDYSTYLLIEEFCAMIGKKDKAALVQRSRVGRKHTKSASWVMVQSKLHRFIAADTGHPQSDEIHAQLRVLLAKIKKAGYIPDTKLVLDDRLTAGEKRDMLLDHSEKLAVAYGIISTKPRSSIRIINNDRVCGDCHAALKLASKVTSRLIVLRDNRRFHHFQNGQCSCKDYW